MAIRRRIREADEAFFFLAAAGLKPPRWYRLLNLIRRIRGD